MTAASDTIILVWAIAALLLIFSLLAAPAAAKNTHNHAAAMGVLLLGGAAVYDMDIINMPEIAGALVIGGAAGMMLAREWPAAALPILMTTLLGMASGAEVCSAIAIWLNPYAFGLVAEGSQDVIAYDKLMILFALMTAGMACILALILGIRRNGGGSGMLCLAIGMVGWSASGLALLLQNAGLLMAGGLSGAAGFGIALRIFGGARPKGLADMGRRP